MCFQKRQFFEYPKVVRQLIYTTNVIEVLNRRTMLYFTKRIGFNKHLEKSQTLQKFIRYRKIAPAVSQLNVGLVFSVKVGTAGAL